MRSSVGNTSLTNRVPALARGRSVHRDRTEQRSLFLVRRSSWTALAVFSLLSLFIYPATADERSSAALERVTRNRPASVAARKVTDALGGNVDSDVLRVVQLVLDLETDSFSDKLSSIRLSVESQLKEANDEVRRRYESVTANDANDLLEQATTEMSPTKLRQVCRRYFLTPAGYTASERLIAIWLDAGEYGLAARLAEQVLAEPTHRGRITPRFRNLVARAKVIGHDELQSSKSEADNDEAATFRQQLLKHRRSLFPGEQNWSSIGGNLPQNRVVAGSTPVPVPTWTTNFFSNTSAWSTREFLRDWEGSRKDLDQPLSVASFPLLLDDQIIFRDAVGLRSVNVASGTTNWLRPCNFNPLASSSRSEMMGRGRLGWSPSRPGGQNSLGENSLMGATSSAAGLVFVVDSNSVEAYEEFQDSGVYVRQFLNRLIAVSTVGANAGRIAWVHDGKLPERLRKPNGSTHFSFLGPPLAGPTEIVCLTELDDEILLSGFETHTGALQWMQPLCVVERYEQYDVERHETACIPSRAEGIVVCPTETGLMVAVDQVRLNLAWATYVDDPTDLKRQQVRGNVRPVPLNYLGYASHATISDRRIVYLPPRSTLLHCLDLMTGKILWSIPRGDAEFVGAVADQQVIVVGKQSCRAISLQDGGSIWSTTTGMPAGRGVAIGDRYVLPLSEGRLASLDLKTGRDLGTKILRSETELGHLVADRERVYSLSPHGLAAFPQIDAVVAKPQAADPARSRDVLLAEANIVAGKLAEADRQLRSIVKSDLTTVDRERARKDLKELLFQRLIDEADLPGGDLTMLSQLLDSPSEEFRFLVAASSRTNDPGRTQQMFALRAYQLPPVVGSAVAGQSDWLICPATWCRLQLSNSDRNDIGLRQLTRNRSLVTGTASIDELMRFVKVFDNDSSVNQSRVALASKLASTGATHAAETLLLRNRYDAKAEVAADAAMRLAKLWEHTGFALDAAKQLDSLATEFADVRLADGLTGADYVRHIKPDQVAKRIWRQSREPAWPVDHVEIQQTTASPDFTEQSPEAQPGSESGHFQPDRQDIAAPGRYFRPTPATEFVTTPGTEDEYLLSVFDHRTKLRLGSLVIPQAHRTPTPDKLFSGGHLVPIGVPSGIMGVSSLELGDSMPAWKFFPSDLEGRKSTVLPGPTGPGFVTFTWKNRVYVIDSIDGSLLWQRSIPVASSDQRIELIGDSQALAVRITDRPTAQSSERKISYEVFETATGRKLSTVRSSFIPGQWQGEYGRYVIGFAETTEGRRLQVRDLLTDQPAISEVVTEGSRPPFLTSNGELVYMGPGGELKIFDMQRLRRNLAIQFAATDLTPISVIRVFSDRSRYFVNLHRPTPTAITTHSNQAINMTQISGLPIRDDLYAFDRATGELLWKRAVPYRTLLNFPDCQIPFLVTVSLVKDRVNNTVQNLTVEVIDSKSGATIGYRENLSFDHLLSTHYDGESGRIVLRGQASDIELRFGPAEGQTQAGPR